MLLFQFPTRCLARQQFISRLHGRIDDYLLQDIASDVISRTQAMEHWWYFYVMRTPRLRRRPHFRARRHGWWDTFEAISFRRWRWASGYSRYGDWYHHAVSVLYPTHRLRSQYNKMRAYLLSRPGYRAWAMPNTLIRSSGRFKLGRDTSFYRQNHHSISYANYFSPRILYLISEKLFRALYEMMAV